MIRQEGQRRRLSWPGGELSLLAREGPAPVVFLHGLCGGAVHFEGAFESPALAGRGLVAVDLPGFGDSAGDGPAEVTLDAMAAACRAVFADLGEAERPALVAHSMSASVASRLLDGISALVLLEGNIVADNLEFSDHLLQIPAENFEREFGRVQQTAELILRMQTSLADGVQRARYGATYLACSAAVVRRICQQTNLETRAGETLHRLADWGRRWFYYVGADGALEEAAVAAASPQVVVRSVPRARHFIMFDNPGETYSAIARDTA